MAKSKKIILLFVAFICLSGIIYSSNFVLAQSDVVRELEIDYPTIPEAETPGTDTEEATTLPEYVKYLFNSGIAIGGILAFLILVYGGFLWLTSAGNPTAIGKAKTKIFGGIIGLCLLLGAFLIIGKVNPNLKNLKDIPDMLAQTGIYLCATNADCEINDPNKRKRYTGSTPRFPKDFEANKVCFISNKDELMSVFIHSKQGYEGKIEKDIENTKKDDEQVCADIPDKGTGKSLSILWNRPGIFLYQEPDFVVEGTDKMPEYLRSSARNLKKWDNITQSMKIRHPNEDTLILGFLFSEPDYTGQCELLNHALFDSNDGLITKINNLDDCELVKDTLSSIYTFTIDFSRPGVEGEVKFYDQQNCKGNSFEVPVESGVMGDMTAIFDGGNFSEHQFEPSGKSAEGEVRSFRINGPFVVMITTNEDTNDPNLECKAFLKPNDSNCYDSVVASNIYSQSDDNLRPRSYYVVPKD